MLRILKVGLCVLGLSVSTWVSAQLSIEITQGVDNPTPIAIVPFAWRGVGAPAEDVARIVDSDLAHSGQFEPVNRRDMLSFPSRALSLIHISEPTRPY